MGLEAQLSIATFDALPYPERWFDTVCDVVSLQHLTLEGSRAVLREVHRVLKPGGRFFSFRLSDASVMFRSGGGSFIDSATVDSIGDPWMPLANNSPVSFWNPTLARAMYGDAGFEMESVERHGRTYGDSALYVEYLAITARKPGA